MILRWLKACWNAYSRTERLHVTFDIVVLALVVNLTIEARGLGSAIQENEGFRLAYAAETAANATRIGTALERLARVESAVLALQADFRAAKMTERVHDAAERVEKAADRIEKDIPPTDPPDGSR